MREMSKGLIPGLARSPGGEHGNPLQYFCLENSTDREAWRAPIYGVTKSRTWLERLSTHARIVDSQCCVSFMWKAKLVTHIPTSSSFSDPFPIQVITECVHAKLIQSCLTLCDPMDYSLPGYSVHGILQAGILAWAAIPFSRGSSQPRDQTQVSFVSCMGKRLSFFFFFLLVPPGKPYYRVVSINGIPCGLQ